MIKCQLFHLNLSYLVYLYTIPQNLERVTSLPHLRCVTFPYTQFSESALSACRSQFLSRIRLLGVGDKR
jgi:hypothetical protein